MSGGRNGWDTSRGGLPGAASPPLDPSWPVVGMSLAALVALGLTGRGYGILGLLAVGLLAARVWPVRLENPLNTWMLRVLLFGAVVLANLAAPALERVHGLYDPAVVHGFGQLCAAELVLQAWRRRPAGGRGLAPAILLAGLMLLAACNTHERSRHIVYVAPFFLLFCVWTALGLGRLESGGRRVGGWARVLRGILLLGVLFLGGLGSWGMQAYKHRLVRLIRDLDLDLLAKGGVGFSDRPILSAGPSYQRSYRQVLAVEGQREPVYLRGMGFDRYFGGRWEAPLARRVWAPLAAARLEAPTPGRTLQVTRLVDEGMVLFLPLHCAGVLPSRVKEVERDTADRALIRVSAPAPYAYSVTLAEEAGHQGPLCAPLEALERLRCLEVPEEVEAGVWRLARRIASGAATPLACARAVERYLQVEHRYSLENEVGRGDPVSRFLLEKKAAHCEYFAAAGCLLLRCLHIPARFVAGYYAHEQAEGLAGAGLLVRQQDAHAWTECWIEGQGWLQLDGTPPESGRPDVTSAVPPLWLRAWEWISRRALDLGDWVNRLGWFRLGALAGGLAGAVVALLWVRQRLRGRRSPAHAGGFRYSRTPEWLEEVRRRYERLLLRCGLCCPAGKPWRCYLQELLASAQPPLEASGLELLLSFEARYRGLRFGGAGEEGAREGLSEHLRQLEVQVGRRLGWRRWWGRLRRWGRRLGGR